MFLFYFYVWNEELLSSIVDFQGMIDQGRAAGTARLVKAPPLRLSYPLGIAPSPSYLINSL